MILRTYIAKGTVPACTTVPVMGIRAPWSLHFFLRRRRKKRSKEGRAPPRSLRPKILGPLPAKTKLARCARSDSRFRHAASTPKSSPSGRPPFQRAGDLNQRGSLCRALAMRIPSDFVFSHYDADLHRDASQIWQAVRTPTFATLPHMAAEVLRRAAHEPAWKVSVPSGPWCALLPLSAKRKRREGRIPSRRFSEPRLLAELFFLFRREGLFPQEL